MINRQIVEQSGFPAHSLEKVIDFLDHRRRPVTESERLPGQYPYYGANGQQGTIDRFLFDEDLILLAEDGGHFSNPSRGIAYRISGRTWVNNHAHVLRPKAGVDLGYLCRVLENYDVTPFVNGTTRSKLTKAGASEIPIPLPPLEEQKRIAAILDKADALRAKRRQAIALLDSLTQSIFLEMFGDPVSNPKDWPVVPLLKVSTKITDGTHNTPQRFEEGVPFLTGKNVRPYLIDLSQIEFVDQQTHEEIFRRCNPEFGDVLYVNIGAGVGNAAMNRFEFDFSLKNVALIKPDKGIVVGEYIERLLNYGHFRARILDVWAQGGAQKFLGLASIKKIEIPCPPLEFQSAFAKKLSSLNTLRSRLVTYVATADSLFVALQHRAFTGQL